MKVVCVSKESYNQIWNNVTVGKIYDVIDKDTYPGEYVLKVVMVYTQDILYLCLYY